MIIEPTYNANNQWEIISTGTFWGCVCNSLTKEGATKVVAMDAEDDPMENCRIVSLYYGFISDTSRQELIDEAQNRGLEIVEIIETIWDEEE